MVNRLFYITKHNPTNGFRTMKVDRDGRRMFVSGYLNTNIIIINLLSKKKLGILFYNVFFIIKSSS